MPAVASLKDIFKGKKLTIESVRSSTGQRLNCRQRFQQKYEPTLPVFSSFFEEIEWRLGDISVALYSNKQKEPRALKTKAQHWIKVALLAGYRLDYNGYLIRRSKKNMAPLHLVQELRDQWEEVFVDCLLEIYMKEREPKEEKKTFSVAESNGETSIIKATDLFDVVDQVFGNAKKINCDERKRCLSMLKTVRHYRNLITQLTFQQRDNVIAVTQSTPEGFYEILILEQ